MSQSYRCHIKDIATMLLSLKWEEDNGRSERFDLLNYDGELVGMNFYLMSRYGLFQTGMAESCPKALESLLSGEYSIRKKLQKGDKYYLLDSDMDEGYKTMDWLDDAYDVEYLQLNRIYRTEQEAKEVVEKLGWKVEY